MSRSEKFLNALFSKLTADNFKEDKWLKLFYKSYLTEKKQLVERDPKATLSTFAFFTDFITRNKCIDDNEREQKLGKLYDGIMDAVTGLHKKCTTAELFDRDKKEDTPEIKEALSVSNNPTPKFKVIEEKVICVDEKTGQKVLKSVLKSVPLEEEHPEQATQPKKTITKKDIMRIISNLIKESYIPTVENLSENITEENEKHKDNFTEILIEDVRKSLGGKFPAAQKDKKFERNIELQNIWHNTEEACLDFLKNETASKTIKKIYVIDAATISTNNSISTVEIRTDDRKDIILHSEQLISRRTEKTYPPRVLVLNADYLTEAIRRARAGIKCLLVCAGSRWVAGGGSDIGMEAPENSLYLASTYSVPMNLVNSIYPLSNSTLLFLPKVFVFRDHTNKSYPLISSKNSEYIVVLNASMPLRAETTLTDVDRVKMDPRLYEPGVEYKQPEKILEQFQYIFETALFLGYDTLIFDDRGVEYYSLPVEHTAKLMAISINRYSNRFKEILVAINDPRVYNIYKKWIN